MTALILAWVIDCCFQVIGLISGTCCNIGHLGFALYVCPYNYYVPMYITIFTTISA